jgi:hypothetical protein
MYIYIFRWFPTNPSTCNCQGNDPRIYILQILQATEAFVKIWIVYIYICMYQRKKQKKCLPLARGILSEHNCSPTQLECLRASPLEIEKRQHVVSDAAMEKQTLLVLVLPEAFLPNRSTPPQLECPWSRSVKDITQHHYATPLCKSWSEARNRSFASIALW